MTTIRPEPDLPPHGQDELVLVVDDEKSVRDMIQRVLQNSGYRVVTAANGAEAVAVYQRQSNEIAVVLMDIAMPVMDGNNAIDFLKAINPCVKIIAASGLSLHDQTAILGRSRPDRFRLMPKPYSAQTLLQTLQQTLLNN